jgi:hypothetical protein
MDLLRAPWPSEHEGLGTKGTKMPNRNMGDKDKDKEDQREITSLWEPLSISKGNSA